jgi:uncharacterized membrane protein
MARYYTLMLWIYVLLVLLWVFLWIPFGIGYYGLPWKSSAFQWLIQVCAWALVAGGFFLAVQGARLERRWWPSAVGIILSLLGMLAMYDWMARYVSKL